MSEIHDYIESAKAHGDSEDTIVTNLKSAGWDEVVIKQAMGQPTPAAAPIASAPASSKLAVMSKKYWKFGLVAVVVALLVVGGAKGYSYYTSDPAKIWADTSQKMLDIKSAHFNFEASYSETPPAGDSSTDDSLFGSFLGENGELKFSVSGDGNMLLRPAQQDADYDMNSTLSSKLGSLNLSIGFQSKKVGDYVYYKTDGNPLIGLLGGSSNGKASPWLKINMKQNVNNELALVESQKNQILDAFKKAKLMSPTKLLGTETVGGVVSWHYQASLNKQELKTYIDQLGKIMNSSAEEAKQAQAIVDKLEFKKLEIWIGKSDHLVHQALIETNAPSLVQALGGSSLDSARSKSRDARRLADARQIMTGLELFYNDNGRYPASVDGQPSKTDGGKNKFSTYIALYPTAPTPADGGCSDANNKYVYQQLDGGKNYKLDFCFGSDFGGGYKAGIQEATSAGLTTITPIAGPVVDPLEGIVFGGLIDIKLTLSDFDHNVKIEAPEGATDVEASARDARRLADSRQVQTALELYYNDNNKYPAALTDLTVKSPNSINYISTLPTAPTPADGSCTDASNKYTYEQLNNGTNYRLTLCIGGDVGGFKAGILEANSSGLNSQFIRPQ